MRTLFGLFTALLMAGAAPALAQTSEGAAASPPASAALIARGDTVYHGPGNCYACHGSKAEGSIGPNLTDAEWIHSKGTYGEIVVQITTGVAKEQAKSGIAMPPRGGATISDDDVKAVAAYIYSLRQK